MAALLKLHSYDYGFGPIFGSDNLFAGVKTMNVIGSFSKWRNYRRTVSELNALSNRELDDLGISRGDIPFVARGTR